MTFFDYSTNLEYFQSLVFSILLLNLMFQVGSILLNKVTKIINSDEITRGILYIFLGYFIISLITQYLLIFDKFELIKPIFFISLILSVLLFKKFKL